MARIVLSDKFISGQKCVPASGRVEYLDALMPGLALRVSERGHRSFVLIARYPSNLNGNPVRRSLGQYGRITLPAARAKAGKWLEMIEAGIDPKIATAEAAARAKAESQRAQAMLFSRVANEYLTDHVAMLKQAANLRKLMAETFMPLWGDRDVRHVTRQEVAEAIREVKVKRGEGQAHHAFGLIRHMYNWAIGTGAYDIESSPVTDISARNIIGQKVPRERVLTDDELRKVWNGADDVGYPFGATTRMLILTGQRRTEIAALSWSEIDMDKALITIPASRMKGGQAHEVPLAPMALALLKELPRHKHGHFVFTTTEGKQPYVGYTKGKQRIDEASGVTEWTLHDLRRTFRTHLSALPIEDRVREAMIAHAQPGMHRIYDRHSYAVEKRRGFELWENRLHGILAPKPPAEVADLATARARVHATGGSGRKIAIEQSD